MLGCVQVLRHVVKALEERNDCVRAAAAKCAMALSRTERSALRSSLLDTDIVEKLCGLLGDGSPEVQVGRLV